MKTSIEVDKVKVDEARKLSGIATLREIIDQALDAFIKEQKRRQMSDMLGTDFLDVSTKDLVKMRRSNK